MAKAIFKGTVIASCDDTIQLEGNHYFPPDTVKMEYLKFSDTSTLCSWKGTAVYYNVIVDGVVSSDAAWSYRKPSTAAKTIKNHVAFGGEVEVVP